MVKLMSVCLAKSIEAVPKPPKAGVGGMGASVLAMEKLCMGINGGYNSK